MSKEDPEKQLNEDIAEARAQGISYGHLMAEKTPRATQKAEREPLAILTCENCGKRFPVYDRRMRKYCSHECLYEYHRERIKAAYHRREDDET